MNNDGTKAGGSIGNGLGDSRLSSETGRSSAFSAHPLATTSGLRDCAVQLPSSGSKASSSKPLGEFPIEPDTMNAFLNHPMNSSVQQPAASIRQTEQSSFANSVLSRFVHAFMPRSVRGIANPDGHAGGASRSIPRVFNFARAVRAAAICLFFGAFVNQAFAVNDHLVFTTPPSSTVYGDTMASIVVQIQNSGHQNVLTPNVPITLTLAGGSGTLSGTMSVNTDDNGSATFSTLTVSPVGIGYTLTASTTTPGIDPSAASSSFNITQRPVVLSGTRAYDGTDAVAFGILTIRSRARPSPRSAW